MLPAETLAKEGGGAASEQGDHGSDFWDVGELDLATQGLPSLPSLSSPDPQIKKCRGHWVVCGEDSKPRGSGSKPTTVNHHTSMVYGRCGEDG